MAQWRRTAMSDGIEYIHDPRVDEVVKLGQLLMARNQARAEAEDRELARARFEEDRRRFNLAHQASNEDRLFVRMKEQRANAIEDEGRLFVRRTAEQQRQDALEAAAEARRNAARKLGIDEREVDLKRQGLDLQRELGTAADRRATATEARQEAREDARETAADRRAAEARDFAKAQAEAARAERRDEKNLELAQRAKAQADAISAAAQADVLQRGEREAERAELRRRQAEAEAEVEAKSAAQRAEAAQRLASMAGAPVRAALSQLTENAYNDPFLYGFPFVGTEPTVEMYSRSVGADQAAAPWYEKLFTRAGPGPAIFGPSAKLQKVKSAMSRAIHGQTDRGEAAPYAITTVEEKAKVREVFDAAIKARLAELQASGADMNEVRAAAKELYAHMERELDALLVVPAAPTREQVRAEMAAKQRTR